MKYTLAFDIYGTLINISGVVDKLEQIIGKDANAFSEAWRSKQLEFSFRRGLMGKYTDFSISTKDALEYCNKVFATELTDNQKTELLDVYKVLPIFSDVEEGLRNLKTAGHKLFAFSNGSKRAIVQLLTNANILDYFDGVVSAEDVETFKPNPKTYEHFIEATNSKKSNTWLISSNPFDIIGSISYGFRSVWVQRNEKAVFDTWTGESNEIVEPTSIVNRLNELSNNLKTLD